MIPLSVNLVLIQAIETDMVITEIVKITVYYIILSGYTIWFSIFICHFTFVLYVLFYLPTGCSIQPSSCLSLSLYHFQPYGTPAHHSILRTIYHIRILQLKGCSRGDEQNERACSARITRVIERNSILQQCEGDTCKSCYNNIDGSIYMNRSNALC